MLVTTPAMSYAAAWRVEGCVDNLCVFNHFLEVLAVTKSMLYITATEFITKDQK